MVDGDDSLRRVQELTTHVRKQALLLMVAVIDRNEDLAEIAAIRVHDALNEARRLAAETRDEEISALVTAASQTAEPWLARASHAIRNVRGIGLRVDGKLGRVEPLEPIGDLYDLDLKGTEIEHLDIGGLTVSGLRGNRATIRITNALAARLAHCEMISCELATSRFDGATIEHCHFQDSNLEATSWDSAQVVGCSFVESSFVDARLDQVVFRQCDFRGADFSIVDATPLDVAVQAMFVRCDLRDTRWSRRSLVGCHFFECKLHAVHGVPFSTDRVEIVRPDLSKEGDRSRVGDAGDVLTMWRGVGLR